MRPVVIEQTAFSVIPSNFGRYHPRYLYLLLISLPLSRCLAKLLFVQLKSAYASQPSLTVYKPRLVFKKLYLFTTKVDICFFFSIQQMQEKDNSNNNDKLKYHDFYHNLTQKGTNIVSRKCCKYREIQMEGKYMIIFPVTKVKHNCTFLLSSHFLVFLQLYKRA